MLVRLVYASRATEGMDDALVGSILEQSRKNNPEHGITGILCVHTKGKVFLQALEGGRTAVNRLYWNIVADPRHGEVTLLGYDEIEERRFANWRMGKVDLEKVSLSSILRYSDNADLDPYSLSGRGALSLLEELVDSAAIVSRESG